MIRRLMKHITMAAKKIRQSFSTLFLLISLLGLSVSAAPTKKLDTFGLVRRINLRGPYIGLITVYLPEERAFFSTGAFQPSSYVDLSGRRFHVGVVYGKRVIYVRCGIGLVNAAAATQQMVDLFDITGIVHFGISGNANSSMSIGDVTIPKEFANTGIWNWMNPDAKEDSRDVAHMKFGEYNVPKGIGEKNLFGEVGFSTEQLYSELGQANTATSLLWAEVDQQWLQLASSLEGMRLEKCINSTLCLKHEPKLVVGLKGSTADTFVDNAAYRDFLFQTFNVSSTDMESSAVVMTCLSNGIAVIVIRGMSDLAGGQEGENPIGVFGALAAQNTASAVLRFISNLPATESSAQ